MDERDQTTNDLRRYRTTRMEAFSDGVFGFLAVALFFPLPVGPIRAARIRSS